ncbi:MAG TPA: transposase [Pseudonocardiaceae bacterium]|jgi:hypothetical protein|nr:transposase [Pseudonocardiaceae bacterium]
MTYPYVFLDATYCKARVAHQVVSQTVVIAIGVRVLNSVSAMAQGLRPGCSWSSLMRTPA